jgi:hypothetical protein
MNCVHNRGSLADAVIASVNWSAYEVRGGDDSTDWRMPASELGERLAAYIGYSSPADWKRLSDSMENYVISQNIIYDSAVPTIAVLMAGLADERPSLGYYAILELLRDLVYSAILRHDEVGRRCLELAADGWLLARIAWKHRTLAEHCMEIMSITAPLTARFIHLVDPSLPYFPEWMGRFLLGDTAMRCEVYRDVERLGPGQTCAFSTRMSAVNFKADLGVVRDRVSWVLQDSEPRRVAAVEFVLGLVMAAGGGGFPVYQVIVEHGVDPERLQQGFWHGREFSSGAPGPSVTHQGESGLSWAGVLIFDSFEELVSEFTSQTTQDQPLVFSGHRLAIESVLGRVLESTDAIWQGKQAWLDLTSVLASEVVDSGALVVEQLTEKPSSLSSNLYVYGTAEEDSSWLSTIEKEVTLLKSKSESKASRNSRK